MKHNFRNVKGTNDIVPPQSFLFEEIIYAARSLLKLYGYQPLILPHLEEAALFQRGVGAGTDIVEKQMFKIEGKEIVLRPEGTAQVARSFIQNNRGVTSDVFKFYYDGAMFRGERPQKGRLREFHHIGVEAIGSTNVYLDAEIIELLVRILQAIKINKFVLRLNSLGCQKDKERLAAFIIAGAQKRKDTLCNDCVRRLEFSPLRILDCKRLACKEVVAALGVKDQHLCVACQRQFEQLRSIISETGIEFLYDPLLVRGLDYYTNTVFEISSSALGSQDALGAGGRYNNLITDLGGGNNPAIGFALGLERLMLVLGTQKEYTSVDVFVAVTQQLCYAYAYDIVRSLRDGAISADIDFLAKSLKTQLRKAQRMKVPFVIIVGEEEVKGDFLTVRNMKSSTQERVSKARLTEFFHEKAIGIHTWREDN